MSNYDIGIIGAGIAGSFAALKIAQDYKKIKTIIFDIGRPPMKRRRQLEGWLGCLPNSDGKLYLNDLIKISELVGEKKSKSAFNNVKKIFSIVDSLKLNKDKSIPSSLEKKILKEGYSVLLNDYYQIIPKNIHSLSKVMSEEIEQNRNITYSFDNEIKSICKQRSMFTINSDLGEFRCKRIIFCVGRSGWRFATKIFNDLGIVENNDTAKFGIRIEMDSNILKGFNKSACSLIKDDVEIGPFNWFGTIIPEDHFNMAISAFRSNENRWKTNKVSFTMIGNKSFLENGIEQTDRLGQLTFVLTNDRISRERVSNIINNKSKISIIPEYDWLKKSVSDLSNVIPEILTKAYFHIPTIVPVVPKINIGSNLETEIDNMFVAGETTGISGILSAAIMGYIAAKEISK